MPDTLRTPPRAVRVLAADDSSFMRHMLSTLFDSMVGNAEDGAVRLELMDVVSDGLACIEAVRRGRPDIVLLDLEMPRLNGMGVLAILQREYPAIAVVMCSASTERGAAATLDALAQGATDYVTKPHALQNPMAAMASLSVQLAVKLGALAEQLLSRKLPSPSPGRGNQGPDRIAAQLIGVGVSTGGPAALETLLPKLPADFPVPIVIVQHMPKLFTRALAERLDRVCALKVREAVHHGDLTGGTVWLAPGDRHLQVEGNATSARICLHDRAPLAHCRPSVDYLFRSMANDYSGRSLGVVLTGMGSDGLEGARALVAAGSTVVVQDQASSAIWGMPGRVAGAGLAHAVLALDELASFLSRSVPWRETATRHNHQEVLAHAL